MGVSHIALAVRDIEATHRFYSEAMGFSLVKVEVVPQNGGFARHAFYSTGSATDQLIAFWDLSNVPGAEDPIESKAQVRWRRAQPNGGPAGIGMRFLDLDGPTTRDLDNFVHERVSETMPWMQEPAR